MLKKQVSKKVTTKKAAPLTRYQRFGLFFFTRARVTLLLWLLLTSFGVACYTTFMQRAGFPDVAAPYSSVSGTYFVNDREKVDKEVSKPLAAAVSKVDGVKHVTSQSGENFFSVQVEFNESITSEQGNQRVKQSIERKKILPASAETAFKPFFVTKLTLEGDDLLISIGSKTLSTAALQTQAEEVAKALSKGGSAEIKDARHVKVIDNYRRGTDPATGQVVSQQQSFDWIATPKDGELSFAKSAIVAVQARPGVDVLHLDTEAQASLQKLRTDPRFDDLQIEVAADFARDIRLQVNGLQENLLGGLLAVLVVSFLLISLRASLITAISMVTVLAITVGLLYVFGLSLNTITLFSLILCLGLIVDDTTIMAEAIDKGRRSGAKGRDVVATAIKKVGLASAAGTLTTMLGFAPLLFVSGILGEFIHAIPITIITSLAVSLLVSITLIPFLARFTLLRGKVKQLTNPISKLETATAHGLSQLVRRVGASRKQGLVIGLSAIAMSLAMFAGGLFFAGKMKFNIFPPTKDSDVISVNMNFDRDTTVEEAEKLSGLANQVISQHIDKYVHRISYQGSGSDTTARAVIDLVSFKDREPTAPELASSLEAGFKDFQGAQVKVNAEGGPAPTSAFAVQIRTEDGQSAVELAQTMQTFLQAYTLKRPDGTTARFKEVTIKGDRSIERADGKRYVEVDGTFNADDTSALVALAQTAVKKEFSAERLQDDFGLNKNVLQFDVGQEAENQDSFGSMVVAFPLLLLAMYILLALQFKSVSQPLLIFLAIPFSLFGVTAGLYFTDNSFSFFTMLAIFALLGIAVNNTILLTDYANKARKEGARRSEAVAIALEERFRPLLTTSLTSVVALIPLALSDPFWEALSLTLIFGLLSSTFLVVIAFPYYYLANEVIRIKFSRKRVLIWLGILILGSLLMSKFVPASLGYFIFAYVSGSFAYIAGRALSRRVARRRTS